MTNRELSLAKRVLAFSCVACLLLPASRADEAAESGVFDDYNQWKQALGAEGKPNAALIAALPGYQVELLRAAGEGEGSWVSLTFDPAGRILIAREDRGIYRWNLPAGPGDTRPLELVNDTLRECRGLLWAFDSLYANANNDKGLYRLQDHDGDDRFDEVKLLRESPGDVGHGRNDLVLGPDGFIYSIHGNDTHLPTDYDPRGSALAHYAIDRPIPCEWNQHLFNYGAGPPGGFVIRTDRDGRRWEMVAGGFRNAYGIDFNTDGEMFTFDADMEWDAGLPWYRPCRVNHIVSGGDYGWRQGVNKWSAWYPDSLPSTLDIGLASPTSVRFGTRSHFPPEMRKALFILDWAYGRIIAVHLTPHGASYAARSETFVRGRPLNVTDLEFGPDGAMYFLTGGRGTQSGLFRVKYVGPPVAESEPSPDEAAIAQDAARARQLRRALEAFHGHVDALAVDTAWPHLASDDLWICHAARVAIEHQPPSQWQERALSESQLDKAGESLLALARVGDAAIQPRLIDRIVELASPSLPDCQKLRLARAAIVSVARHGSPDEAKREQLATSAERMLAGASTEVNQLACELLAALDAPSLPSRAMTLLASAKTQEERVYYLYLLRLAKQGWSPETRRSYVRALAEANTFTGARYVPIEIDYIKSDALANVPEPERAEFAALIERQPAAPVTIGARAFVRHWEVDDLEGSLDLVGSGRDLERGRELFQTALCARCHRLGSDGTNFGPDLSAVAARFGRRDLLEAMISPSKVIDDKYRGTILVTKDGRTLVGLIAGGDAESVIVHHDPLEPKATERVAAGEIAERQASSVSPMPAGLLDTLSKEEVLDLLGYLEAAGRPTAAK